MSAPYGQRPPHGVQPPYLPYGAQPPYPPQGMQPHLYQHACDA
ncbi:hypothetical protein [Actinocorallia lasiicapitis]